MLSFKFKDKVLKAIADRKIDSNEELNPIKEFKLSKLDILRDFISNLKIYLNLFISKKRNVSEEYEEIWTDKSLENEFGDLEKLLSSKHRNSHRIKYRGLESPRWWFNSISLLMIEDVIKENNFDEVLEIGSGNGINLLYLGQIFPEIDFYGYELTSSGVQSSQNVKNNKEILSNIKKYFTLENSDTNGEELNNLKFKIQDVRNKIDHPVSDKKKLVFTNLALEQMDKVYYEGIKNILNLDADEFIFIEPFREFQNPKDILLLKNKGYLNKNTSRISKSGFKKDLFRFYREVRKIKYAAGIVKLRKNAY